MLVSTDFVMRYFLIFCLLHNLVQNATQGVRRPLSVSIVKASKANQPNANKWNTKTKPAPRKTEMERHIFCFYIAFLVTPDLPP